MARYIWHAEIHWYNIGEKEDDIFGAKRNAITWVENQFPEIQWKDPDPEHPYLVTGATPDREFSDDDVLVHVIRRRVK